MTRLNLVFERVSNGFIVAVHEVTGSLTLTRSVCIARDRAELHKILDDTFAEEKSQDAIPCLAMDGSEFK